MDKELQHFAKKRLGMKDEPLFAEHLDKTIIANDIGRYFVRKVENIRNEIDATPISQSDRDLVPPDKSVELSCFLQKLLFLAAKVSFRKHSKK